MAEWLGTGLQNLVHRFNSGSRLQTCAVGNVSTFMKRQIGGVLLVAVFFCGVAANAVDKPGKRFRRTDKNKDGVLQPVEIRKAKKEKHKQRAVVDKKWEKKADVNHDGKVDPVEIRVYRRSVMDTSGDGKVSIEERRVFWLKKKAVVNTPAERRFDLNHDGVISGDEAQKMMSALLVVIKTNGKAKVNTSIEKEFDANNDGFIDATEADGVREALGLN